MLLDAVITVLGFVGLTWGADKFVFGASAIARNLGVSPLVIGLTIVAFGTSAPEIFSSAAAAFRDKPELAIGNAVGSNLFNIGVALGIAAIIRPLTPPKFLFKKEIPALLLVTVLTGVLFANFYLGIYDALILISVTIYFGYRLFKKRTGAAVLPEIDEDELKDVGLLRAGIYLLLGLILLVLSAEALVSAASSIAEGLGVSTAVIGLTVVALGTSLPELATSITCALRGHFDLAIGNIVGSNILNLLAVLPFPALFSPGPLEPELLTRDYSFVMILTLLLALFCYRAIKTETAIGRVYGSTLLLIYCGWFTVMLYQV
ncbi:MAG: calcium/sodium antiporter [Pseudohongiellaceae bacterium]